MTRARVDERGNPKLQKTAPSTAEPKHQGQRRKRCEPMGVPMWKGQSTAVSLILIAWPGESA